MTLNVMVLMVLMSHRDGRVRWWVMGGAHARVRAVHGTTASMLDTLAMAITLAPMRHASSHVRPCGGRGAM